MIICRITYDKYMDEMSCAIIYSFSFVIGTLCITITDPRIRIRKKYLQIHNTACNMHLFRDITILREQLETGGWNKTNKQRREKKIITVMTCAKKIMCIFSITGHAWKITPITFVHHLSVFCDTWHSWFLRNGEH